MNSRQTRIGVLLAALVLSACSGNRNKIDSNAQLLQALNAQRNAGQVVSPPAGSFSPQQSNQALFNPQNFPTYQWCMQNCFDEGGNAIENQPQKCTSSTDGCLLITGHTGDGSSIESTMYAFDYRGIPMDNDGSLSIQGRFTGNMYNPYYGASSRNTAWGTSFNPNLFSRIGMGGFASNGYVPYRSQMFRGMGNDMGQAFCGGTVSTGGCAHGIDPQAFFSIRRVLGALDETCHGINDQGRASQEVFYELNLDAYRPIVEKYGTPRMKIDFAGILDSFKNAGAGIVNGLGNAVAGTAMGVENGMVGRASITGGSLALKVRQMAEGLNYLSYQPANHPCGDPAPYVSGWAYACQGMGY